MFELLQQHSPYLSAISCSSATFTTPLPPCAAPTNNNGLLLLIYLNTRKFLFRLLFLFVTICTTVYTQLWLLLQLQHLVAARHISIVRVHICMYVWLYPFCAFCQHLFITFHLHTYIYTPVLLLLFGKQWW